MEAELTSVAADRAGGQDSAGVFAATGVGLIVSTVACHLPSHRLVTFAFMRVRPAPRCLLRALHCIELEAAAALIDVSD